MNGYWKKLGRIFDPESKTRHPKLITHAANPLPVFIEDDIYRIYYSGRDRQNRSSIAAVDIDIIKRKIIKECYEPLFSHGPDDSFYSEGLSIGNTCQVGERILMYFMGWKNTSLKHWYGEIGALEVHKDLTLSLAEYLPIKSLNSEDPISLSYPWVSSNLDGTYHMWYGSTEKWDTGNGEMLHIIKSATSVNGIDWTNSGLEIPHAIGLAQAFSRPSVLKNENGSSEMWFSYRSGAGQTYRIGRATSKDNRKWKLNLKNSGINVSKTGWDSQMIEYPFVFKHKKLTYMLYNGNDFGKSGFGLAIWINKNKII